MRAGLSNASPLQSHGLETANASVVPPPAPPSVRHSERATAGNGWRRASDGDPRDGRAGEDGDRQDHALRAQVPSPGGRPSRRTVRATLGLIPRSARSPRRRNGTGGVSPSRPAPPGGRGLRVGAHGHTGPGRVVHGLRRVCRRLRRVTRGWSSGSSRPDQVLTCEFPPVETGGRSRNSAATDRPPAGALPSGAVARSAFIPGLTREKVGRDPESSSATMALRFARRE